MNTKMIPIVAATKTLIHTHLNTQISTSNPSPAMPMTASQIHIKALEVARRFKNSEFELIEILQLLDARKTFREYECTSLYDYAVKRLKLSEDVAANFITVSRKAADVPSLHTELQNHSITISKARKICSVLTNENQKDWLELARTLSSRELERKVAGVNPRAAVCERLTYVTGERLKLVVGVSEQFQTKLKRAQDLVSNSLQAAASFEQALEAALDLFLEKRDPLQKAERYAMKIQSVKPDSASLDAENDNAVKTSAVKVSTVNVPIVIASIISTDAAPRSVTGRINSAPKTLRTPIPAKTNHDLNLRDQAACTHLDSDGNRCGSTRWLERHHRTAVAQGGDNRLENLLTLCSSHHQLLHRQSRALDS